MNLYVKFTKDIEIFSKFLKTFQILLTDRSMNQQIRLNLTFHVYIQEQGPPQPHESEAL